MVVREGMEWLLKEGWSGCWKRDGVVVEGGMEWLLEEGWKQNGDDDLFF